MMNLQTDCLVDFVGIGAPRAGTTYLDSLLRTHPQLHLPLDRKEVHYFDQNLQRGSDWYRDVVRRKSELNEKCGEVTPAYLYHPGTPEKLFDTAPGVRLILCVRDPVKRAFSHYLRVCELMGERRSFLECMGSDSPIFTASEYARHVKRWIDVFEPEQLLTLTPESLSEQAALDRLAIHLGVAQRGFVPPAQPVNATALNQSTLYRAAKSIGRLAHRHDIGSILKVRMFVSRKLGGQRQSTGVQPQLDADVYKAAASFFQEDSAKLQQLIGFNAEHAWPELFQ